MSRLVRQSPNEVSEGPDSGQASRVEMEVTGMAQHIEDRRAYARPVGTNGFAIASLVLGIVWAMGIGSILALVFGYIGKSQIDESGGDQTGRGLAIAGIVLGWIGVAFLLFGIVMMAFGWMDMPSMGGGMMNGTH